MRCWSGVSCSGCSITLAGIGFRLSCVELSTWDRLIGSLHQVRTEQFATIVRSPENLFVMAHPIDQYGLRLDTESERLWHALHDPPALTLDRRVFLHAMDHLPSRVGSDRARVNVDGHYTRSLSSTFPMCWTYRSVVVNLNNPMRSIKASNDRSFRMALLGHTAMLLSFPAYPMNCMWCAIA